MVTANYHPDDCVGYWSRWKTLTLVFVFPSFGVSTVVIVMVFPSAETTRFDVAIILKLRSYWASIVLASMRFRDTGADTPPSCCTVVRRSS